MLLVDFDDFDPATPWGWLNGRQVPTPACALDLALGAMTVGRPRSAPTARGRLMQMASIALDVLASVDSGPPRPFGHGDLAATPEYWDLDPTERAATTYRVGMGAAKYIGEAAFGLVEVIHLSLFAASLAAPSITGIGLSRRRADLVGQDINGNWVVLEAKGRSNTTDVLPAIADAKTQAEAVQLLAPRGTPYPIFLRLATVIDVAASPFSLSVRDPPETAPRDGPTYVMDPDAAGLAYYSPLFDLLEAMEERPDAVIEAADVRAIPVASGVAIGAIAALLDEPPVAVARPRVDRPRREIESQFYRGRVGRDGFALLIDERRYLPR